MKHRVGSNLHRAALALALLASSPLAWAADPPGAIALDWPMGTWDGAQVLPGYNVRVMQNYNNPNPDFANRRHSAMDLALNSGTAANAAVYAAADGIVTCTSVGLNYPGRVVVIEHTLANGSRFYTQYGHLNEALNVTEGRRVNRGMQIGTIVAQQLNGQDNAHLHFEVRNFRDWAAGNCWGPGYAEAGLTPDQQGWFDPVSQFFFRRPALPARVVADTQLNIRSAPNLGASVLTTVAQGTRLTADQAVPDNGGGSHWWYRVNYSGSSWGYIASYVNNGWGGELFANELAHYPGPTEVADLTVSGTDLYIFARAADGSTSYRRRASNGVFTGWSSLGGFASSDPVSVTRPDGRVQVFVRGGNNYLHTRRQAIVGGGFEDWAFLGGSLSSAPAVAVNSDGRLQVFVRWTDGSLWTRAELSPGGSWGSWVGLGGILSYGPTVIGNSDGRLSVFAAGLNNDLFQIAQTSPGGGFGSWQYIGGQMTSHPSVVRNSDGKLEVFVRGVGFDLRHIKQTSAGGGWGAWQSRGGVLTAAPAAVVNQDGRLEVFVRGTGNALHNIYQTSAGGGWSGFNYLEGLLTSGAGVAAARQNGLLQLVVLGGSGQLFHRGFNGTSWSPFLNLGGTFAPF